MSAWTQPALRSSGPDPLPFDTLVSRLRAAGCVFAEEEARLLLASADSPSHLAALVERRTAGLPLEQVVGWAEFCGLRIAVRPGVFVPRRRTEFLARQAAALVRSAAERSAGRTGTPPGRGGRTVVVDLCCGSGAVGAVLLAGPDPVALHATDLDPEAVRCARRNLTAAGPDGGAPEVTGPRTVAPGSPVSVVAVHEGDLYRPLPRELLGRVDVLVVNAPYVPTGAIDLLPPEARDHEPRIALDGGADGLDVQRRVAAEAARWLAPDGHLLVETSDLQVAGTTASLVSHGLACRVVTAPERDATVVVATLPAQG